MALLESETETNQTMVIPLGKSQNGSLIYMRVPYFHGKHASTTIIVTGMTGTGKSVLTRTLISYLSLHRPVYVFDWAGRDHYLGIKPNRRPKNLPRGASPRGVKGYYFYYPVAGARSKAEHEYVVKPNFSKYSFTQLESLGFSGAGPANLGNVMKQNKFSNVEEMLFTIQRDNRIMRMSRETIIRDMNIHVLSKDVWDMDGTKDVNAENLVLSQKNLVFSYNDLGLARAEIDYFFRRLTKIIDKNKRLQKPFIFVEEAHKVFETGSDGVSRSLENFVLVCRKLGIGLCLTMPTLETLGSTVAGDVKEWVIGKLKGRSASLTDFYVAEGMKDTVRGLRLDRYAGDRDFVYYSTDMDVGFTFEAFECPQEYNRQV